MLYRVTVQGNPPGLLTHNIDGGFVPSKEKAELDRINSLSTKAKKEPANVALREQLEWTLGLYTRTVGKDDDAVAYPTLPPRVIRSTIHCAAKLSKDGQRVNRGLQVKPDVEFTYGHDTGKTVDELWNLGTYRHDSVVAVQRQRVLRVRPLFPEWAAEFTVYINPEICNDNDLKAWVETAGNVIGFGDWRPDKGGEFGTFSLESITEIVAKNGK